MCGRVLFVDDEQNVLSAIKRMFFDSEYQLFFASSGKEGLSLLSDTPVDVIVSDMRMPEMDGVEFLKLSRDVCPEAIRIVLSGQAEIANIMDSINFGAVWRYIAKPWNDNDMKITIHNALDLHQKNQERKLLLSELAEKNSELLALNESLELKVAQRTKAINTQNQLLSLIIQETEIEEFFRKSCSILSPCVGCENLILSLTYGDNTVLYHTNEPPESLKNTLKEKCSQTQPFHKDDYTILPLIKNSSTLGLLAFTTTNKIPPEEYDQFETTVRAIFPLALSQHKAVMDAPGMISTLDDLLTKL